MRVKFNSGTIPEIVAEFARFASDAKDNHLKSKALKSFLEDESPTIDEHIFEMLPDLLRQVTEMYCSRREKDISLISSIVGIGSLFPKLSGIYDERVIYPYLYAIVVAPPGSGKGIIVDVRTLIQSASKKIADHFIIPGNTSASALISQLSESNVGIIIESESQTIRNAFMQEWGAYGDLLLKAYHHEPISRMRVKKANEVNTVDITEVEFPLLAMIVSGTPETVKEFINGLEDGLFSRVMFYTFNQFSSFRDVRPNGRLPRHVGLRNCSIAIEKLYDLYSGRQVNFRFTSQQWDMFLLIYQYLLSCFQAEDGVSTESLVKRSGLNMFRVAMILSAIRQTVLGGELICKDEDFECALVITLTILKHNYLHYLTISNGRAMSLRSPVMHFYEMLEPEVRYLHKNLVEVGSRMNISPRTVSSYKEILCSKGLVTKAVDSKYWFKS